ncbi:MAG TPA: hypothetical protein VK694_01715 [Verrucomicrobiae bacterium]|nr:hypothetical protein [Verrucomicrobiae bacterium]
MAVFRRRNNQTNVPAEIQEYYQTERRERAGVAWLLALGTLLVTVLLAVGLFFGSRWVYRKVAKNDKPNTSESADQEKQEQQPVANNSQAEADRKKAEEEKKKQEEAMKQADAKAAEEKKKKDEEAKKQAEAQRQQTPAAAPAPSPQQVAGTQTRSNIPNTGAEDTLAIFMILVIAGYLIHRILINASSDKRR